MQNLLFSAAAAAFLLIGAAMAYYDWARTRAGRPLMGGGQSVQLYWMGYMMMFALAITCVIAAVVR
jgi:hypothetical protein